MKILQLLSGGIDSSTALYKYKRGAYVAAIFFDYGQKHIKEQLAADKICKSLGVKLHNGKLAEMFVEHSRFSAIPITVQHGDTDIITNRNMNLITASATYALTHGFDAVSIATNKDDTNNGFPDCSKVFMRAMKDALRFCHTRPIELLTPFIDMSKRDVVEMARNLNVPIEETWSCYKGGKEPCGGCSACLLRNAALENVKLNRRT